MLLGRYLPDKPRNDLVETLSPSFSQILVLTLFNVSDICNPNETADSKL